MEKSIFSCVYLLIFSEAFGGPDPVLGIWRSVIPGYCPSGHPSLLEETDYRSTEIQMKMEEAQDMRM